VAETIEELACALADAIRADSSQPGREPSDVVVDAKEALIGAVFESGARPSYVRCVCRAGEETSVCTRRNLSTEFSFVDWAHADANEANGGRLVTCPTCKAVRQALREVFG